MLVYMSTRIIVNLSQVYLPFYLQESLYLGDKAAATQSLALVPLTLYISSFVATIRLEQLNRMLGRKATYALGNFGSEFRVALGLELGSGWKAFLHFHRPA